MMLLAKLSQSSAQAVAAVFDLSVGIVGESHLLVVVQDHNHVAVQETCVVHGLIGHTSCDCTVTNDSNHAVLLALEVAAHCHSQASGNGGTAVASTEGVVLALITLGETCGQIVCEGMSEGL